MTERDELSHPPLKGVRALVLGAGFGTRLKPLTEHVPKPVVPLLGRPLIGHPLIHLYAAGCFETWVNSHHMADKLAVRLDAWVQRRLQRMRVTYSVEQPEILGTGGALKKLEGELTQDGSPFLLLNGDSILEMDLPSLWGTHSAQRAHGALATLLCIPHPDAESYGAVRVDSEGRIVDLAGLGRPPGVTDEDVAAATPTVFCGVHVIEPGVLAVLPPSGTFSGIVRQGYAPLLNDGADLRAHVLAPNALFHDVGTPSRYLDAQEEMLSGRAFLPVPTDVDPLEAVFQEASYAVDATGREYGNPDSVGGLAGATLEPPFLFGPRNFVGPGATIGPSASIGALNTIAGGATVKDAALWAEVEVGAGERLEGVLAAKLGGERIIVDGRPA
ncbi:MAG: NDP-sugar synthase [Deltaproteobacteria bacterium]|nr:NDP-sugar synthase [Deltaproteobacteria bacterium]